MSNACTIEVKICGLKTPELVEETGRAGADYIGFNFYPKSPRYVPPQDAQAMAASLPETTKPVALLVNPSDAEIEAVSWARWIQLHGAETPERCQEIREKTGASLLKVIGVSEQQNIASAASFTGVADMILFDSKPHKLPGGNGIAFDWHLLQNANLELPWMLSGGLDPANVREAIKISGATRVDVASGVESSPGEKSLDLIRAFIKAAKQQG